MLLAEHDLELLEGHLDGALSAEDSATLQRRLDGAANLAGALDALRADRAERRAVWAALEPTEQEVERCVTAVMAGIRKPWAGWARWRTSAAIAACVALAFFAGWTWRGKQVARGGGTVPGVGKPWHKDASGAAYQVALTDESGHVTAVQNFDSFEKANEFANDLGYWQQRQERLREGAAVIVADQF
jgi:hypothetical protein